MKRIEALRTLVGLTADHPVVATCAATSRELASVKDSDNHLYMLDAMGLVGSVATGLALSLEGTEVPKVVGIEGDGSLLMNPNVLPTGGYLAPTNLLMVVLDNRVYGSTAGLPTYANKINLLELARASGWNVGHAHNTHTLTEEFERLRTDVSGPGFLHVITEPGNADGIAKLLIDPTAITHRFTRWITQRTQQEAS